MPSRSDRLPRRVPQQSEAARVDRALSWSGQIVEPATACTDLETMRRVYVALLTQLTDPDASGFGKVPRN